MLENKNSKDKVCAFYASDYHFEMMTLPYISKKLDESKKVVILSENNLNDTINVLMERTNLKTDKKNKILNLNWNNNDLEKFRMISENVKNQEETIIFVKGKENYIENMYLYLVYTQILLFGLYIVLFALMLTVVWKIVISFNKMSWYDVWFLSVLNVAGGLFAEVIINISIVKIKNEVFDLFQVKEELLWKLPLIAVLLFLGELAAITIYQKYRELQREKENYFVEQQQIKAMKLRLEEAENFYGSIRKVRHEMKNHMTNIKGLAARDQYEEIDRYIEKLDATIEELDYKYATGNAVTDVLINDKYKKAIREEILFDVKFDYRDSDTISVFDMGMILNNLLDNAIEACRKIEKEKRYIRLSLKRKDNFLLITVENSFDGILQQAEDGLPRTMKETELPEILMEHGVGLRNVRELAERYFGAVNIEAKGNRFKVTVMLQKQQ